MSTSTIKIVILQRGWSIVGRVSESGDCYVIEDASVIRRWGTNAGLGQLATAGPRTNTILDKAGRVTAHKLTTIALLDCDEDAWKGKL